MDDETTELEGTAETVAADEAASGIEANPEQTPTKPTKTDLTQDRNFREFQAKKDKEVAMAKAEVLARATENQALQQRLNAIEAQLSQREQSELATLDPEERAEKYRLMLEQQRAESVAQQQMSYFSQQAYQRVNAAGLDWNDPRLNNAKSIKPSNEGLIAFVDAIAQIKAEEANVIREELEQTKAQYSKRAKTDEKREKKESLIETGALATTASTGATSPGLERAQMVDQFKKRLIALRGQGTDNPVYRTLRTDMRKAGVTDRDLGYQ